MAQSAVILQFQNKILEQSRALGNSKRGFKEVASDLCNDYARGDKKAMRELVEGTFLSRGTIQRVMDCEEFYNPQSQTCERILRFFGAEVSFNSVSIKPRYRNKEKVY